MSGTSRRVSPVNVLCRVFWLQFCATTFHAGSVLVFGVATWARCSARTRMDGGRHSGEAALKLRDMTMEHHEEKRYDTEMAYHEKSP